MTKLTILICTYNRAELLEKTIDSLNAANRPADCHVEILVVANACTDSTASLLSGYAGLAGCLALRWIEEPTPGKSFALNRGIAALDGELVAFVDDDHRVDRDYLVGIGRAARTFPEATLFCGRIIPDWDGSEPDWVHDTGPYRIYPLPVPRSDLGPIPQELGLDGPLLPGGGNLFLRRAVFDRVGGFSVELGPHGHDLGGGEDSDFVTRCLRSGERLQYVPWVTQYHYVDGERLRFSYVLHKSYQRSRSGIRLQETATTRIPIYIWRKIASYTLLALFAFSWPRARFYMVRLAASFGELRGFIDRSIVSPEPRRRSTGLLTRDAGVAAWLTVLPLVIGAMLVLASNPLRSVAIASAASFCALGLLIKSFYDFSQTGPELKAEILRHYRAYSILALIRLALWAFALCAVMATFGVLVYLACTAIVGTQPRTSGALLAALVGILLLTGLQFCRHLLFLPGSIAASYHYRKSRLYPLWRRLTPGRLMLVDNILRMVAVVVFSASSTRLLLHGGNAQAWGFLLLALGAAPWPRASRDVPAIAQGKPRAQSPPNILMIGSDTLRADRLGAERYRRNLTPFIDSLASNGCQFTACYVPCARTAPSLISLLTGTWPHHHGIRDNFIGDDDTRLSTPALASVLAAHGYRTAAVSDWSGGDMGKFPLGFEILDLPDDQWNIKYLMRQGPKDLRLFLSLFTHNRFGKRWLPELYYLAGVPLTSLVGRDARELIGQFAANSEPFFLNVFISTTHPPFGSEYPYYTLYRHPEYAGESQFVMARLTDPWEIIRRQGDSRREFDLEQIIDLYDGCVRSFDDEARRIVDHLRDCGVDSNTIVVIYSDHGMEFFEHDTWGQGNSVRGDFSARIPLVIFDPRRKEGGVCSRIVRSIDVVPTLLELVGLSPSVPLDGVSLVPYLKDVTAELNLAAFNETGVWLTEVPGMPRNHLRYPNLLELLDVPDKRTGTLAIRQAFRQAVVDAKDRMVRVGPWKLTYQPTLDGPIYALYNVVEDPECRHDVSASHRDFVLELQARLHAWMGESRAGSGQPSVPHPGTSQAAVAPQ